jgi:hypothetical protein
MWLLTRKITLIVQGSCPTVWGPDNKSQCYSVINGLENREHGHRSPSRWPSRAIYTQNLELTTPTSGSGSVRTVLSRSQATEFSFRIVSCSMRYGRTISTEFQGMVKEAVLGHSVYVHLSTLLFLTRYCNVNKSGWSTKFWSENLKPTNDSEDVWHEKTISKPILKKLNGKLCTGFIGLG